RGEQLLVVVGGEKVEGGVFRLADFNVAITSQPHSEAAALAVFLDWLQEGRELERVYDDARILVEPSERGKKIFKR
ncbi:MAG: tRNA (cytidine(56)-2'-O)-methyltransferase, partial [Candidatus Caldarchaeum sp.]